MIFTKTTITSFVLGALVAIFVIHAYAVYDLRKGVLQNSAVIQQNAQTIGQIVQLLNGAQTAPTQAEPTIEQ